MYKLSEILDKVTLEVPFDIEVRVTTPNDIMEETGEYDMLFGYCRWDGKELISLDGDSYYLDDEVISYEIYETESGELMLCVIEPAEWASGSEINDMVHTARAKKVAEEENAIEEALLKTDGRARAKRRKTDFRKAVRKRKLAKAAHPLASGDSWKHYDNLHQYSKNKIHCKESGNNAYSDGDAKKSASRIPHWGTTNGRYGKNYKVSDRRAVDAMNEKEKDYMAENLLGATE